MHPFTCSHCGNTVFFDNSECGVCGLALGYLPGQRRMAAGQPAQDPAAPWAVQGEGLPPTLRPCGNRALGVCNWLLDDGDLASTLCRSCRLTTVIPALDVAGHRERWQLFEQAKRRLLFTLDDLGLSPPPQAVPSVDEAARDATPQPLSFRLLAPLPDEPPVTTGHDRGVITLNLNETDTVHREATRVALGESMRTLLGHLRHEAAHWLQYRYINGTPAQAECSAVFGDESEDYATALQRHYEQGPPPDWRQRFISAYASAHPWEDWAETCAHYLLIVDAVQTAAAWGLRLDGVAATAAPQAPVVDAAAPLHDLVIAQWLPVARFLNAMNRSLGHPDSYPFLLPPAVLDKMSTVQRLLAQAAAQAASTSPAVPEATVLAPVPAPVPAPPQENAAP